MSELTLLLLRLGFLALLWVFVFAIVYALRSDLFGQRVRRMPQAAPVATFPTTPAPAPVAVATVASVAAPVTEPHRAPPLATPETPRRLVITSGPREGTEVDLPAEQLTIGRSSESGLVIRDDYTSTHHARLLLWNDEWTAVTRDLRRSAQFEHSILVTPTGAEVLTVEK